MEEASVFVLCNIRTAAFITKVCSNLLIPYTFEPVEEGRGSIAATQQHQTSFNAADKRQNSRCEGMIYSV